VVETYKIVLLGAAVLIRFSEFRHFCWRIYRLAIIHFTAERQTNR